MNRIFKKSRGTTNKTVFFFVTGLMLLSTISIPEKAEAQLNPPGIAVPTIESFGSTLTRSAERYVAKKGIAGTGGLDNIAWLVAKVLIKAISRSTIAWINSGFRGNPAYIQNPQAFLLDIADQEIGSFIEGGDLSYLCSPFQLQIKRQLLLNRSFRRKSQCTLTRVVRNFDDFVNGTERTLGSAGGWSGWFAITTQPQNNAYGAFAVSQAELDIRVGQKVLYRTKELDWGKGFLSWRDCSGVPASRRANELDDSNCPIVTPGTIIEDSLANTLGSNVRQLEIANEFGEIVSALAVQLTSQVLGSSGLFGLSQSRNGNPSYLSQLGDDVVIDGRATLSQEINIALSPEQDYLNAKNQSLGRVAQSESLVNSLIACYQRALVSTSTVLTQGERIIAQGEIASASSTLLSSIRPIKTSLSQAASTSASNIASLVSIRARLSSVLSLTSLESLRTEFQNIYGYLHTASEAGAAREEYGTLISPQMVALDQATNGKLTQCRAFPSRDTNIQ